MKDKQNSIVKNISQFTNYIEANNFKSILVAVSKYRTENEIIEAARAGQKLFGENRVQEAKVKWPRIKQLYPNIKLHLIGPLQSNKCADAVALFDVIEVIDRKKIIDALAKEAVKQNRFPELLIQVNISNEKQKSGCKIEEIADLINYAESKKLSISGLMCIPKSDSDPTTSFTNMKNICDELSLATCSMGMSNDYKIALKCGSTQIRIGTAIFGPREF